MQIDTTLNGAPSTATFSGAEWRARLRDEVRAVLRTFVAERCEEWLGGVRDAQVLGQVLRQFVEGGKFVRSAFVLAGWRAGAPDSSAAVHAGASMELLHCFALLQDDVMDASPLRRGRPAAHVLLAEWHRREGLSGAADRFGESAAVLAADLCLVWAEQMLRECGADAEALARAMPRYDRLRSRLAVGQFRDLVNDARRRPSLADVRDVARAKSGDYTVRGPVELGATLAGASSQVLAALGRYGHAVGEAFQLRDDVLGLFGSPAVTGKPVGEDLLARKATSLLVLARELASIRQRRELAALDRLDQLTASDADQYVRIIEATGAREHVERLIAARLAEGLAVLHDGGLDGESRDRLTHLARLCANRDQ